jgi:hypothetical protein
MRPHHDAANPHRYGTSLAPNKWKTRKLFNLPSIAWMNWMKVSAAAGFRTAKYEKICRKSFLASRK